MGELSDIINTEQNKGIFKLPEKLQKFSEKDKTMRNFKARAKELKNDDKKIFEDSDYFKRTFLLREFGFNRELIEDKLIPQGLIRPKYSETFTNSGAAQALDPLAIAQVLSWAREEPIENIIEKQNKYLGTVADYLMKKLLSFNKKIELNSSYTLKEIEKLIGLKNDIIKIAISRQLLKAEIKARRYHITGLDAVLYSFKNTSQQNFNEQKIKEMFGFPGLDIDKLELRKGKNNTYKRELVFQVYDKIAEIVRNRLAIYEMDYYEDDLDEKKEVTGHKPIVVNRKKYDLSELVINSLIYQSKKFAKKRRKQKWNDSLLDYIKDNLEFIFKAKPSENGLYTGYNTATKQIWRVQVYCKDFINSITIQTKREVKQKKEKH